ncbi:hypothetical protein B0T16DRAFT_463069 [Cercophora newfieldiana]|uniref:Uncharacterized protein n=1 Tax=Cercophora newfieldiana TaxID=92897 RepID=A0AA39XTI6_9PEZI|nr:hypothetical protein B0T16DRAFT_463069 [Cercophora newfieldiana]
MPPSPSLLSIPFEVRTTIIHLALLSPQRDPPHPDDLHKQQRQPLTDSTESRRILIPRERAANPALPLLLTNHQLHTETLDTLQRSFQNTTPCYTADIIYLTNGTLWPTWLSTPVRASHAETVHAHFRIFRCPPGLHADPLLSNQSFNGQSFMYSLHHLLLSCLVSGRHGPCGKPLTVNRLVLDFLPATEPAEKIFPLAEVISWEWLTDPKDLGDRITAKDIRKNVSDLFALPEELKAVYGRDVGLAAAAGFMCYVLRMLEWLGRLDSYVFEYAKALYENVGVVEMRVGGELHKVLDLGTCLGNAPVWERGQRSWLESRWHREVVPWMREVQERRRGLGLPVEERE